MHEARLPNSPDRAPAPEKFRTDIEGLRGVAILLVVLYHSGLPAFSGGYVGVDVFFALSGYLITGLLAEGAARGVGLGEFYGRRARRLLPAAALMLALTCAAGYFVLTPVEQNRLPLTAAATAAYVGNFYFAAASTNYLGHGATSNPFLHAWSLGVEEQFYLAWPVLVLFSIRLGRRRLAAAMAFVLVVSLALCLWLTRFKQPWAFFLSPPRAWEFAAGGLVALFARETRLSPLARWLGLAAILWAGLTFTRETPFPGWRALLPVAGTAALLHAGDGRAGAGRLLGVPPLRLLGRLSYSWYLWHWPALVFAAAVRGGLTPAARGACLLTSLALAWASYRLVENPVRRARMGATRSLALAACLTAGGLACGLVWQLALWRAVASLAQSKFVAASGDRPSLYRENCQAGYYEASPRECSFGDGETVVLFGDSHAAQWFPALRAAGGLRVVTLIKQACAAPDVGYFYAELGRRYTECEQWREAAARRVVELRPAAVVIGSSNGYTGKIPLAEWEAGTRRTLEKLAPSGARLYLLRDTPRAPFDVPSCLSALAWRPGWLRPATCSFTDTDIGAVARAEQSAAGGLASYVDLTQRICPGGVCAPEGGGVIVFADTNHLTATFSASLAPAFAEMLAPVTHRP